MVCERVRQRSAGTDSRVAVEHDDREIRVPVRLTNQPVNVSPSAVGKDTAGEFESDRLGAGRTERKINQPRCLAPHERDHNAARQRCDHESHIANLNLRSEVYRICRLE